MDLMQQSIQPGLFKPFRRLSDPSCRYHSVSTHLQLVMPLAELTTIRARSATARADFSQSRDQVQFRPIRSVDPQRFLGASDPHSRVCGQNANCSTYFSHKMLARKIGNSELFASSYEKINFL
jgi:hypothetical protein